MKIALALLALVGTAASALTSDYVENNYEAMWASFKTAHNKTYSAPEESARKAVFKVNMLKAAELQKRAPSATYGMNKFSDLTEEETYPMTHRVVPPPSAAARIPELFNDVPAEPRSVDWRQSGAVTGVKDQTVKCGACWAFSTTGSIESANFLHGNGKLTPLSEQELVSCGGMYAHGCGGGYPYHAYEWLITAKGGNIVTEKAYPYTSMSGDAGNCTLRDAMEVGATITSQVYIPRDESQMAVWLAQNGPISVLISYVPLLHYTGGVVTVEECPAGKVDHAVLVVGVTPDYWIIKNSFGPTWGEGGYFRLKYGTNTCNIIDHAPCAPVM